MDPNGRFIGYATSKKSYVPWAKVGKIATILLD
jgi:hypothetical protein